MVKAPIIEIKCKTCGNTVKCTTMLTQCRCGAWVKRMIAKPGRVIHRG